MSPLILLRGILIGLSIAAPVGPIGVLCIRRTLSEGRGAGLASGLGAATADLIYGCIAGFGLTAISNLLIAYQDWVRLIGGLFLCYLGLKSFFTSPDGKPSEEAALGTAGRGVVSAYSSTFFLTLTNPMTILSFTAIFAGLGIIETDVAYSTAYGGAATLVLGVFVGSGLWWLSLSAVVGAFRDRFTPHALRWVNRLSGVVIVSFGLVALFSVLRGM